jgi:glycosyltransferase involved in cell wall biosynthesis
MIKNRIALTTWFHYHNYGTALQAIALSSVIKSLGYKVDILNYIPYGKRYSNEPDTSWGNAERVNDKKRDKKFKQFINKNFTFTAICKQDKDFKKLNLKYNAFIAGSDQIWSPIVFDERYFLDYVSDNRKRISYASSFGVQSIENNYVKEKIKGLISQFSRLSVREEQGQKIIKELTGNLAEIVLDPTLLLNYEEWRNIIKNPTKQLKEKYILCYFLGENKNAWKHVKQISARENLQVKVLPVFVKDPTRGHIEYGVAPKEFFNLIDNAEIVLTDSFHGAIFSLICETPFYLFERFSNDDKLSQNSRVHNLLNITKLNNRLIRYDEPVRNKYDFEIDFSAVQKIISEKRLKSIEYLKESLPTDKSLVSIIIPVYNVELFIERGLKSLKNQTYKNIEVIVVDDGSQDNSGKIADEFAQEDKRFKVIHKQNGGVSTAKNTGLDNAKGKYVVIMDGDDAVAPDYVEYLLSLIENTGSEIACSLNVFNENNTKQISKDKFEIYSSADAIEAIYLYRIGVAMWNKIWRRDFIEENHLRCHEELFFSEGMTFCVESFVKAKKIGIGRRRIYWQEFFNPNSATRKFNIKAWENGFLGLNIQKKAWEKITSDSRVSNAYNFHVWWCKCSVARKIWLNNLENEYKEQLKNYVVYIRENISHAFQIPRSDEEKQFYKKISENPKKCLLSMNIEESKSTKLSEKLPFENKRLTKLIKMLQRHLNVICKKYRR